MIHQELKLSNQSKNYDNVYLKKKNITLTGKILII